MNLNTHQLIKLMILVKREIERINNLSINSNFEKELLKELEKDFDNKINGIINGN